MSTIKLRRDTAANWLAADPVLAIGEPGFETDTGFVKYGDGTSAWGMLPYSGSTINAKGGSGHQIITDRGTLRIGDTDPFPTGTSHFHIRMDQNPSDQFISGIDLFFGDDDQFLRLANDGSVVVQARYGAEAPTIVTGSPTAPAWQMNILSITHGTTEVPVVTLVDTFSIDDYTKVYIDGVSGNTQWENFLNGNVFYAKQIDSDKFELWNNAEGTGYTSVLNFAAWIPEFGGQISVATVPGDVIIAGAGDTTGYGDVGDVLITTADRGVITLETENGTVTVDKWGALNLSGDGVIRNNTNGGINIKTVADHATTIQWDNPQYPHTNYLNVDYGGIAIGSWDVVDDNHQLLFSPDGRLRLYHQGNTLHTTLGANNTYIASKDSIELAADRVRVSGTLDLNSLVGWATEIGGPRNQNGWADGAYYNATMSPDGFTYAVGAKYAYHPVVNVYGQHYYRTPIITKFDSFGAIVWNKKIVYTGSDSTVDFSNSDGGVTLTAPAGPYFYTTINFYGTDERDKIAIVPFDSNGNVGEITIITSDQTNQFQVSDTVSDNSNVLYVGEAYGGNVNVASVAHNGFAGPYYMNIHSSYFEGVSIPDYGIEENVATSEYYISNNDAGVDTAITYINVFNLTITSSRDKSQKLNIEVKKDVNTGEYSLYDWGGGAPGAFEVGDSFVLPGDWVRNNTTQLGVYSRDGVGGDVFATRLFFLKSNWPTLTTDLDLTAHPIISARDTYQNEYYQVTDIGESDPDTWYVELDRIAESPGLVWDFETSTNNLTVTIGLLNNNGNVISVYFTGTGDTNKVYLNFDSPAAIQLYNPWLIYEIKGNDAVLLNPGSYITTYGGARDDGFMCVDRSSSKIFAGGYSYATANLGPYNQHEQYVGAVVAIDPATSNIIWQKMLFDDSGSAFVSGIAVSADGTTVFVTGQNDNGRILVASYNASNGNLNWMIRLFNNDPIYADSPNLVLEPSGDLIVSFEGGALGSGQYDLYIVRMNPQGGQVRWYRQLGIDATSEYSNEEDFSWNSVSLNNGNIVIAGSTGDRFGGHRNSCYNAFVVTVPLDGTGTGTYPIAGPNDNKWVYKELVWDWDLDFGNNGWSAAYVPSWESLFNGPFDDLNWTAQAREYATASDTVDLINDFADNWNVLFEKTGTIDNVYQIKFEGGRLIQSIEEDGLIMSSPYGTEYVGLWYAPEADGGPLVAILAGKEANEDSGPPNSQIIPEGNKATIYVEGNSWFFDASGVLRLPGDVTDLAGDSIILAPALTLNQNTGNVRVKTDMEFTGNYQGTITRFGSNNSNTVFLTSVLDNAGENTYILGYSNDNDRHYVLGLDKQGNEVMRVQLELVDGSTWWRPNHIKFQRDNSNGDTLMVAGEVNWGSGIAVVQLSLSGTVLNEWIYNYNQSDTGNLEIFDLTADSSGAPIVVGRETGDVQTYTQVAPVLVPTTFHLVNGGRGYNSGTNIPVTGGNGSGMTVDVVSNGLNVTSVTVNQQGSFYTVGDQLTIQLGTAGLAVSGYNFIGNFDIGVTYNTNDVVNYNGRTYVCVSFIGGQAPDSSGFWQDITVDITLTSYWQQGSSIGQLVVNISDLDSNNKLAPWQTGPWQIDVTGTGTWVSPDRLCIYYDMPTENLSGSGIGFVINVGADTVSPVPNYAEVSRSGLGNYLGNGYTDGDLLAVKGSLLGGVDTQRFINVVVDAAGGVQNVSSIFYISKTLYPTLGSTVNTSWFVRMGTNKYAITDVGGDIADWAITVNTPNLYSSTINLDNGGNDCVVQWHSDNSITLVPELSGAPALPTQIRFSLVNSYLNTNFGGASGWNIRQSQSGNGFIWSPNFQTSFGSSQGDQFHSVTYNHVNNQIYVAGDFDDVHGYSQTIAMNLDAASGNVYWTKKVQDDVGNGGGPSSIVWANTNAGRVLYLVSVNYNGYTLVTKLNPNDGTLIWQRRGVDTQYNSGNNWYDYPTAAVDANGSVILGGEFGANTAQNNVTLYSKIDQAGTHKWSNYIWYDHYSGNGDDINEFYNNDNRILSIGGNQFTTANYYYDRDFNYNQAGLSVRLPVDDVWDSAIHDRHGPFQIADYTYAISYEDSTLTAVVEDFTATSPGTFSMSFVPSVIAVDPFGTSATETNFVIGNASPAILFNDGSALKSAGFTRSVKDTTGDKTFTLTAEQNNTFLYFTETMGSQSIVLVPDEGNLETPFPVGYTVKIVKREGNSSPISVAGNSPGVVILGSGIPPGCNNWIFGGDGFSGVWTLMKIDLNTWIIEGPNLFANC